MSEKKQYSYHELWKMWLENLNKPAGEKKGLDDFLRLFSASDNAKKTLRLVVQGGDY